MDGKKQASRYVTNTEAFRDTEQKDQLTADVHQAIGNTEMLWDEMRKMQADIESLKRRVADLEAAPE